ncbi:MAG: RNA-binding domain-containing protein, partial [Candidatus Desantisbacteria bacterium]
MIFRGKKLSDLQVEDLQRLVTDQVQERDTVEYKRDMYGNSDANKKELLKDITSMANHHGGYLLIGIDENDEGIPVNVVGIEPSNHDEQIRSCCLDNIDKRIIGLEVRGIPLGSGRAVIVISIPESFNAPHMVTHTGLNQFWKRHGRQKDKMTIDEVGEAFDRRLSNRNRLDRFLFTRKADILENIGEQTFMIMSASPAYLRDEIVLNNLDENLITLIQNPQRFQNIVMGISCGRPYPTINGLRADNRDPFNSDVTAVHSYIEIFSNGYLEFGTLIKRHPQNGIRIKSLVEPPLIVDFMGFVQSIYEQYLPFTPLVISFSILNAQGIWLAVSDYIHDD